MAGLRAATLSPPRKLTCEPVVPFKGREGGRGMPCRVGRYLVVDDNGACGGMGVTFDGVYVKRSSASPAAPGR